jgi:hypothetical protein
VWIPVLPPGLLPHSATRCEDDRHEAYTFFLPSAGAEPDSVFRRMSRVRGHEYVSRGVSSLHQFSCRTFRGWRILRLRGSSRRGSSRSMLCTMPMAAARASEVQIEADGGRKRRRGFNTLKPECVRRRSRFPSRRARAHPADAPEAHWQVEAQLQVPVAARAQARTELVLGWLSLRCQSDTVRRRRTRRRRGRWVC